MRLLMTVLLGLGLMQSEALATRVHGRTPGLKKAAAHAPALATRPGISKLTARSVPARVTGKPVSAKTRFAADLHGRRGRSAAKAMRPSFVKHALVGRAHAAPTIRSVRWSHGLPPAAGVQADACPAGTLATLARGHDDVVRCMPI